MKLNKELSQQSWQEVKHSVLDDCFGCREIHLVLSSFSATTIAPSSQSSGAGGRC